MDGRVHLLVLCSVKSGVHAAHRELHSRDIASLPAREGVQCIQLRHLVGVDLHPIALVALKWTHYIVDVIRLAIEGVFIYFSILGETKNLSIEATVRQRGARRAARAGRRRRTARRDSPDEDGY
ncbi:hypothetical protein FIBSPDRAFT_465243 [Athelia psychrophila]|uniref:Uncharacterized protein n=1 Tax=Athelia psychrophila TaxID=1759441 RepID=A0A166LI64_9AGAM|nr:hypothetical protein FIBSPDRAFT_465243 [Fibularhizoctonia sp. CBS 109695]